MKLISFSLLGAGLLNAQQIQITKASVLSGDRASLEIDGATEALVESSSDLSNGSWVILGDALLTPLVDNRAQVIAATAGASRQFYRAAPLVPLDITATVREGGDLVVTLADASGPRAYRGLLDYQINFLGVPGQDEISGQLLLDGSTFTIPMPDLNDSSADFARSLSLILTSPDGNSLGRLSVGNGQIRTVTITDDDSSWGGIMIADSDESELPVHLFIADESQAFLRQGETSFLPPNPAAGSDGAWPAQTFISTSSAFEVSFGPITVPTTEADLLPPTETSLELVAVESGITENIISGTFTLTTTSPTQPHLTFAPKTGSFTIHRTIVAPPENSTLTNVE